MRNVRDHQLIAAAESGNMSELEALLANPECEPLCKDGNGWTALMHAAFEGHADCVTRLIAVRDMVVTSKKGRDGLNALMCAAASGNASCIQQLIPVSDPLDRDHDGWTALIWAAFTGVSSGVGLLLPVGDVLVKNNNGLTAHEMALDSGHVHIAQLIASYSLALREKTALDVAISHGKPSKSSALKM